FDCLNGGMNVVERYPVELIGREPPPPQFLEPFNGLLVESVTDQGGRHTADNRVRGDVLGHHRARGDDRAVADRDAPQYGHVRTQPNVVSDARSRFTEIVRRGRRVEWTIMPRHCREREPCPVVLERVRTEPLDGMLMLTDTGFAGDGAIPSDGLAGDGHTRVQVGERADLRRRPEVKLLLERNRRLDGQHSLTLEIDPSPPVDLVAHKY